VKYLGWAAPVALLGAWAVSAQNSGDASARFPEPSGQRQAARLVALNERQYH